MNNVIATVDISKCFGKLTAVDQVSLHVGAGEIYGFLGLNGAGKTTMIRMLLGMIKPTAGRAYINGRGVGAGNYELWKNVGYMVETPNAYPELTVYENLEIARKLRNIKERSATKRIVEKLALTEHMHKRARDLSLGNKQRLGIAKALIHQPQILILDEPTNGLDPAGIVEVRNLLKELAANRGVTILVSSHLLGEISKTARKIGIIHKGKLLNEFDVDEFERLKERRVQVKVKNMGYAKAVLENNGYAMTQKEDFLICSDPKAVASPEKIAEILVTNGCPPRSLGTEQEDLESYFLRLIGEKGN
ncbi:ABC transporter ATP-binding protein [Desulfitobacterium sp. AusDCA]|uniref:ABC transporter ATP-binding protein n=1 Tax=Desulfitobacterium sp. AusDCA TaxID=3240383 RepID=UPI003DA6D18A